jgi:outer membrane protein TolC
MTRAMGRGVILVACLAGLTTNGADGQGTGRRTEAGHAPDLPAVQAPLPGERPLPINLPTALKLAGAAPLDIAVAVERVGAAEAVLARAKVNWLPTIMLGGDYFRHDGQIQDVAGKVFTTSKSTLMAGAGPSAVFAFTDAVYAPLAARQLLRARQGDVEAARNDSLLAVAEAYFTVQQARGELAGSTDAVQRAEELARRTEQLASGLAPAVEKNRALTELARRRQGVESAYERWQTASADLNRLLRLPASSLVEPVEAPQLRVQLIELSVPVDDLIPVGLTYRPELASQQALVQATLARLRQEKIRPLVPSVLIRGAATNPAGTLSSGYFGGGFNDTVADFSARNTIDVQVIWELQNLGLGNRAAVRERQAENQQAVLQLFRTQDFVAAEIVQAHAQAVRAVNRLRHAELEVRNALETAEKNVAGLSQTRRVGEMLLLVFRPQEVVASIQALDQAYRDYYGAVADANRAEFRLYRALGRPAQCILEPSPPPGVQNPPALESAPMPGTLPKQAAPG